MTERIKSYAGLRCRSSALKKSLSDYIDNDLRVHRCRNRDIHQRISPLGRVSARNAARGGARRTDGPAGGYRRQRAGRHLCREVQPGGAQALTVRTWRRRMRQTSSSAAPLTGVVAQLPDRCSAAPNFGRFASQIAARGRSGYCDVP